VKLRNVSTRLSNPEDLPITEMRLENGTCILRSEFTAGAALRRTFDTEVPIAGLQRLRDFDVFESAHADAGTLFWKAFPRAIKIALRAIWAFEQDWDWRLNGQDEVGDFDLDARPKKIRQLIQTAGNEHLGWIAKQATHPEENHDEETLDQFRRYLLAMQEQLPRVLALPDLALLWYIEFWEEFDEIHSKLRKRTTV
jgi:hypothetical protein